MVDTISNTRGIGRGVTRYAPSSAASGEAKAVTPVAAPDTAGRDPGGEGQERRDPPMRLEIAEDPVDGELVYRFVDKESGEVLRQWDGRDLGRLRDYVRARRIHLIDKKV